MTNNKSMDEPIAVPKWDVALEALVRDEYQKKGEPLTVADLRRLAMEYAIRFDDIVVTLFELCMHGVWQYRDRGGNVDEMTRERYDELTSGGRLKDKDLLGFDGGWSLLNPRT